MINLSYKQQIAFNSLSIILGNALYALTVVLFLVPSGLITGGATGIALAVNKAVGLPVSGVLFVINITMLVLGWIVLGRRFAVTTVASTILSPMFLALWERVFAGFVLTDDLVLNTIFAGFGVGISLGITIRAGASTGGAYAPAYIVCGAIFFVVCFPLSTLATRWEASLKERKGKADPALRAVKRTALKEAA